MAKLMDEISQVRLTSKVVNNRRSAQQLGIMASASRKWLKSGHFILVKVETGKLPLVACDMMASADGVPYNGNIPVVDVNINKVGKTAGGYFPRVAVLAGADGVRSAKQLRSLYCTCWVGEKALKLLSIQADHAIGANELLRDLGEAVREKYNKNEDGQPSGFYYYVVEAYPYENYCIINLKGKTFRQNYTLDPITRKLSLTGKPVEVFTQYKTENEIEQQAKDADMQSSAYSLGDPAVQMNPAYGGFTSKRTVSVDGTNYGADDSELNIGLSLMSNVEEALSMYLEAIKDGSWKPVGAQYAKIPTGYASAVREAQIVASAMKLQTFSPMDFIRWQQAVLTSPSRKLKHGISASGYAYVGDKDDPSTWFLRCDSVDHVKQSLKQLLKENAIPKFRKPAVKQKLYSCL